MTNQNNEKSKNGKRLALILIALLLIVAVAFGAYTYSKYISEQKASGTATVADWGYSVSITQTSNNGNVFFQYYDKKEDGVEGVTSLGDNTIIAKTDAEGVVAPGVEGSIDFSLSGNAEVSALVKVALEKTAEVSVDVTVDDTAYVFYPVQWTLTDNKATSPNAEVTGSLDVVIDALKAQLNDIAENGQIIKAGDTTTLPEINYTLSWKWAFTKTDNMVLPLKEGEGVGLTLTADDFDKLDTLVGQKAAGQTFNEPYTITLSESRTATVAINTLSVFNVGFSLEVSATQVQENS